MGNMQGHTWRDLDTLSPEELSTLEPKEALFARIRAFIADLCTRHGGHGDQEAEVDFKGACDAEKKAVEGIDSDSNGADSPDGAHESTTILIVMHRGWIHALTQLLLASDGSADCATTEGTTNVRGLDACTSCRWPAGGRELVQTRDYLVPNCSITELKLTSVRAVSDARLVEQSIYGRDDEGDDASGSDIDLKKPDGRTKISFEVEVVRLSSLAAMPATLKGAATTVEDPMV